MPRRMTPAQAQAAIRKLERDQKRAVAEANREIRKYNAGVKKAVSDYNREVRSYNTKARAHNRSVENQRRRLRQEISRLNSQPQTTTFVQYRESATAFADAYEHADASVRTRRGSAAEERFLDLVSDEAANSVYLANALAGEGSPEDAFPEDGLREPSLVEELSHFGDDVVRRWSGALFSLSPANPDAARHFCTSAREVVISLLDISAPDDEVKLREPDCQLTEKGAVTRRSKLAYLLRKHGVASSDLADAVTEDVDNLMTLFRTFNDGTHGHAGRFGIVELSAIRSRVEGAVLFLHTVVTAPSAA